MTAAAGLDLGVYTLNSQFNDPGYCTEYGQKVSNALNPEGSAEAYGNVNLLQAYQHSINAVFCNIGQKLGAAKIIAKAKDFGFYTKPPIELPSSEVSASEPEATACPSRSTVKVRAIFRTSSRKWLM